MSTMAVVTMTKMMESLPETLQNQVLEHLRNYLEDIQMNWNGIVSFKAPNPN